jgi:hypothetical protein
LVAQYVATVNNDQAQIDYAAVQLGYTAIAFADRRPRRRADNRCRQQLEFERIA